MIAEARALGGPYVFRLNLNQQSSGTTWDVHKALMQSTSPIVDCGVHYVDVMCQITDATPVRVHGIGLRLSNEIAPDMYNYGQFQVVFSDGSVAGTRPVGPDDVENRQLCKRYYFAEWLRFNCGGRCV